MTGKHRTPERGKDAVLITALAAGATRAEAARAAGVTDRTVRNRLREPDFAEAVARARATLLDLAAGKVADVAARAVGVLAAVMDDDGEPTAVRVRAAVALLERAWALRQDDVERRLAEIERRLDERDGADADAGASSGRWAA